MVTHPPLLESDEFPEDAKDRFLLLLLSQAVPCFSVETNLFVFDKLLDQLYLNSNF